MTTSFKLTNTLNELTLFIHDRIAGYQTAARETKDAANQAYYQSLMQQSEQFVQELNGFASAAGGDDEDSTTLKGRFYRGFMDAKALVVARNEQSILDSNIYGEEWALKAYREALESDGLPPAARAAVERQYAASQQTYEQLKGLKAQG
ncbi:PA2169 family four-helix-bundle protein [uncultured Hymenobacter sp.]|uniref:PA2169 family four-helix-bundle protein n=1 Tax=uncultured Hymenobacter sp. TaxID=170016 RepID=UPI0035C9B689